MREYILHAAGLLLLQSVRDILPLFFSDRTALYAFKQKDIFCNSPTGCSSIPPVSGKEFHWLHDIASSSIAGIAPPSAAEAHASIKLPGRLWLTALISVLLFPQLTILLVQVSSPLDQVTHP